MAKKHVLEGLMKWSTRDPWGDRFEQILEDHLIPTCDEMDMEPEEIVSTIGEELFMSLIWMCAFEDFLTRDYEDLGNVVDDYLKRRGWKETASARTYMTALRVSTMSLYEVSEIVPGVSFRARDLVRGGEPILITERTASRTLKPWDRIAARVVQVGSEAQISGGVLPFEHRPSEDFLEAWRQFGKLSPDERRKLAEDATGEDFDEAAFTAHRPDDMLRSSASMFSTFWLADTIDRIETPPELRNSEGDELVLCEARHPLASETTNDDIRAVLDVRPELRATSPTSWSWVKLGAPAGHAPENSLKFESMTDDDELVLGSLVLEDRALVLAVNSLRRCDLGCALLVEMLGSRLGAPLIATETVDEIMASGGLAPADTPDLPETRADIHEYTGRYYHKLLDQPVPMLGDLSPRAAVKTDAGRHKVADWVKLLENRTARSDDTAMASYDFGWLWTELGIADLRR